MDLVNDTPLPSALIPSSNGEDEVFQLVLTAMTLAGLDGEGRPELATEQRPLRLAANPPLSNDAQHLRDCVSVCVTGFAYPFRPGDSRGLASLTVGKARFEIAVFGPRVWEATGINAVKPSSPRPFERVAMTWNNAFGGTIRSAAREIEHEGEPCIVPEFEQHYPPNPVGMGYAISAAEAVNCPLPALEDPEHLIGSLEDQPESVCFAPYPLFGSLRAASLMVNGKLDLDRMGRVSALSAPRTTLGRVEPNTRVLVEGMRPGGQKLELVLPEPPVLYRAEVGAVVRDVVPYLDTIEIDAESGTARLVYRAGFSYPLIARERRRLEVVARSSSRFLAPHHA